MTIQDKPNMNGKAGRISMAFESSVREAAGKGTSDGETVV
jgi:hypothetical protein